MSYDLKSNMVTTQNGQSQRLYYKSQESDLGEQSPPPPSMIYSRVRLKCTQMLQNLKFNMATIESPRMIS